ncbi:hypothetical protein HZB03_04110 [Candidatus Woesearchaeota archaeon]|nr:hypothetical protein [Candidatus Woesearchaeota archaeon]
MSLNFAKETSLFNQLIALCRKSGIYKFIHHLGSVENIPGTLTTTAFPREIERSTCALTRGMPHRGMSARRLHIHYHELGVVVSERGVEPRGAG